MTTRTVPSVALDSRDPRYALPAGMTSIELHLTVRAIIPIKFDVQYLSESTLKQWLYGYEREGIIALVDKYSQCGRQAVIDDNEDLKRYVLGFMLKFPLVSASKVKAALAAQKSELDVVHEQTIARFMRKWKADNAQLWTFITHPDKWKNVYMPAFGSHFEGIERLNQLWEMDSTPWDCQLIDGRHTVLGVIDLYSRRTLYYVSKLSTAEAVCRLLRKAILFWGVPEGIRTDNGKDYVSLRCGLGRAGDCTVFVYSVRLGRKRLSRAQF